MKVRESMLVLIAGTICLLGTSLNAQSLSKWTPADIIAKAEPGQWVEIEGIVQEDSLVQTMEIEFLTGDFMDDDWELGAKVQAVNATADEFQVLSVPVKVSKHTEFDNGINNLAGISPGMLVKLEGSYLNDGVFLAKEVDNKTDRLRTKPQWEKKIKAVGKIGQVDEAKRIITVMGIQFQITEETEGKSPIR